MFKHPNVCFNIYTHFKTQKETLWIRQRPVPSKADRRNDKEKSWCILGIVVPSVLIKLVNIFPPIRFIKIIYYLSWLLCRCFVNNSLYSWLLFSHLHSCSRTQEECVSAPFRVHAPSQLHFLECSARYLLYSPWQCTLGVVVYTGRARLLPDVWTSIIHEDLCRGKSIIDMKIEAR